MTRLLLHCRGRMRWVPSSFRRFMLSRGGLSDRTRLATVAADAAPFSSTTTTAASSILKFMFPNSIQETVKSTLLDKATREDGDVWSNSKDDTYHRHHPRYQQQSRADSHPGTDGAVIVTVAEESSLNIDRSSRWDDGAVNEPIMSSSLSPYASATNNTIWQHHDPLDDLLLEGETTKYWPALPPGVHGLNVADPFKLAKADVDSLSKSIREDLIGTDHPVLNQAASYFFGTADGGKKVRPLMIMLVSRALADAVKYTDSQISADTKARSTTLKIVEPYQSSYNEETMFIRPLQWQRRDLPEAQRRLAEISEMIHTASLFHDDVIDGSDIRRGNPAVHMVFGNKTAILAGDYLLARASIALARLRHVEVVETMSTIIEHLVRGEIMQMRGNRRVSNSNGIIDDEMHRSSQQNQQQDGGSANDRMLYYLKKNYYKTGSLMANSCKSAALLADCPKELVLSSYQYGKHLGMAFQLVDDVLDFEGDVISMGKPALADLRAGLSTAPVLFAAEEYPELEVMMDRKFKNNGDVEKAREWVLNSSGMERTKNLARVHAERAMDSVVSWPGESIYRDALVHLAYKIVERTK